MRVCARAPLAVCVTGTEQGDKGEGNIELRGSFASTSFSPAARFPPPMHTHVRDRTRAHTHV